jgi:hypothetical protein
MTGCSIMADICMRIDELIMESKYSTQLHKVFEVQKTIQDIHPYLERLFPIAIVENDQFLIYENRGHSFEYVLATKEATPMPIPQGVRAAFPLESYDNRMVCVVTGEVFDTLSGYVAIFHEFMHCQQGESCEQKLKHKLGIARKAQESNNFTWEINHPFPYATSGFVQLYEIFLQKYEVFEIDMVRQQLKALLDQEDYEYMVWQEWKEGFARYIENRINHRLSLPENHGGKVPPFSRVTFYEGGSHFIEILEKENPDFVKDIEQLFGRMFL